MRKNLFLNKDIWRKLKNNKNIKTHANSTVYLLKFNKYNICIYTGLRYKNIYKSLYMLPLIRLIKNF